MRVLYIINSTTRFGGATKSFLIMLLGLRQKGVEPYVLLPDNGGIYEDIVGYGIPHLVLPYRQHIYPKTRTLKDKLLFLPLLLKRLYLNWRAVIRVQQYVLSHHIELIHTNTSVVNIGFEVARILHLPHIYHIREYADKDFGMHYIPSAKVFHRRLLQPHSYSISITKDIMKHHHVCGHTAARCIYNGIQDRQASWQPVGKQRYFLFAGRVEPAKGVAELLDAYLLYTSKTVTPVPLYLAGELSNVDCVSQLKSFIHKHQLSDLVRFLGPQTHIDQWMSHALAIIISSRNEAFGRCMPEAMLNDCLVIAHDTGGTKEQLDNGLELQHEEIALRYNTIEQLADHLQSLDSQNTDDFIAMRRRAFDTVNELYSNERYVSQVYNFYQEILCTS